MILENILKLYLDYDSVLGPYKIKNNRLSMMFTKEDKGEVNMFGRIKHFDNRSRQYSIRSMLSPWDHPRSYTWRCQKTLDQGNDGACVGFAWAHELISRPAEVLTIDAKFAKEQLYFVAQKLDPWEGGAYSGAGNFYEGTAVLAGAKAAMITGLIGGYYWAFSLEDLIRGIGYRGPAVIGVNWYESMNTPSTKGFIIPAGRIVGGHAVLVRGVNMKKEFFTIRNSWGGAWGKNGDCKISFVHMKQLLYEEGEAVFALRRRRTR